MRWMMTILEVRVLVAVKLEEAWKDISELIIVSNLKNPFKNKWIQKRRSEMD